MTILAFEFSSDRRSVALARNGEVLSEAVQQTSARTTNAFGLVKNVLAAAKIAPQEIEMVVTALGPGSYTGIRAAIAMAQGWQLARGVKLLGVSSVECLAAQAQADGVFGRVNVVIDAQRDEYYVAVWDISARERREISPLKIVPAAEVNTQAAEICVGPQAGKIMFPTAAMAVKLAMTQAGFVPGEKLEPVYLREVSFVKSAPPRLF